MKRQGFFPKRLLALLLICCLLPGGLPTAAADRNSVDLRESATVTDDFLTNRQSIYSEQCHIAAWQATYSLFDVGAGAYLLYCIHVPAGETASAVVDFKDWTNVGNGGVHQYSSAPKTRWYVSDSDPGSAFGGNTSGWEEIAPNEALSLKTYTYTYTLSAASDTERTIFACMKFSANDTSHSGKPGWNDGAWVDRITFTTGKQEDAPPPQEDDEQDAGPVIDLVEHVSVTEELQKTHAATLAMMETGRWVDTYSLYDLGVGQYLVYRIDLPATDGVSVTVDFKEWTDVGNGGVHQYSSLPKTEWLISDHLSSQGAWTPISPNEALDLDTYTYTYTLSEKGEQQPARTIYACLRFVSNASQYHGLAGGNDGAWIDAITFDRIVSQQQAVEGVTLDQSALTIAFGKTATLRATLSPVGATLRGIEWTSSDPTVAVVERGVVRAMGPGTATITATTQDGGFTASCIVTVPNDTTEIVLNTTGAIDTDILRRGDDDATPPLVWYHAPGTRSNATNVVAWEGVTFRDFGANAYSIYKLRIPGGCNARILLDMVINYTDANGTWNGVLTKGAPRLHIYYTMQDITLTTMDDAIWTRADLDSDWSAQTASYAFTVSSMSSEERTAYVKVYSTDVGAQGAWITALGFDTIVPTPEQMFIKPPSRTLYRVGDVLDLSGLIVGVRYSDGSEAILSPAEYVVAHEGALALTDTEIRIQTADGAAFGSFAVHVIEEIDGIGGDNSPAATNQARRGVIIGIAAVGVLLIGGITAAALLYRKHRKGGKTT